MNGTPGWEARRKLFADILQENWRKLADSPIVRGMMVYDDPAGAAIEQQAITAAGWKVPTCPLGLQNNLQHQVYHLLQLWQVAAICVDDLDMNVILEIGGGFGAMHAAVRSRGFSGAYWIHDFPEMMRFQKLYAAECACHRPVVCNTADELPRRPDLAIAMWSMSEMPPESRKTITDAIRPRAWLIGYRDEFEGLDA